jgi:hypothetical protein
MICNQLATTSPHIHTYRYINCVWAHDVHIKKYM